MKARYLQSYSDIPDTVVEKGKDVVCSIYTPRKPKRDSGLLIGLLHGWLGRGTLGSIAQELAHDGHTVFTVDQSGRHAKAHSKAVHWATKTAVEKTGVADVLYMGHSLAAKDIVQAALYQRERENPGYVIHKLATVDGVGTNGRLINPLLFAGELANQTELLQTVPKAYVQVLGKSAATFLRNPLARSLEGLSTLRYDATDDIATLRSSGVTVEQHFHVDDMIVIDPQDGRGISHEGGHMTFVMSPYNALAIARAA